MNNSNFIIVSHRGYSSKCPENTFASFDLSMQNGFNHIEFDLQLTKDGIPIVIHDDSIDRTTNGTGLVKDFTYKELAKFDAGSSFKLQGKLLPKEIIPRFDLMLQKYAKKAHLYIELKSSEFELVDIVSKLLKERDILKFASNEPWKIPGITIISFDKTLLEYSKNILPTIRHGFLVFNPNLESIRFANAIGCYAVLPYYQNITKEFIEECNEHNLFVGSWGFSNIKQVIEVVSLGVQAVTVNWPLEVHRLLKKTFDWHRDF